MNSEVSGGEAAVADVAGSAANQMPAWNVGELPAAPHFGWHNWAAMLGPGLLMAGSAIGSGEWLLGPAVSAKYGGALLWVTTLSILCQFIFNMEASRYTLYTGEPILIGKFRLLPSPIFWLATYLVLDFGAVLPYQIANVATTVAAMWMGRVPDPQNISSHAHALQLLSYVMLLVALLPLIVGGKVYNSLKVVMLFKVVFVLGFLIMLAVFFSSSATWLEITSGFFKFGNVPVKNSAAPTENVFVALWNGHNLPNVDLQALPLLTTFAAIAGVGGLAQTTISNYTREQGWGMGKHVGAIPSVIGGLDLELSHTGTVFKVTPTALARWKQWYRHVLRDQLVVWVPASLIGIALPSMLSVEFLPRGTEADQWALAGMTAQGVQMRVGGSLGVICWYMVLLCGFLVLLPNAAANADSFVRRWVDAAWTSTKTLRSLGPDKIGKLYFGMLVAYFAVGVFFLTIGKPMWLIVAYGNLGNFALGFSCWHTLVVNTRLLPRELRPGLVSKVGLALAGTYFFILAILTGLVAFNFI